MAHVPHAEAAHFVDRQTLCVSGPDPGLTAHAGNDYFQESVARHFQSAENNAAERLFHLKTHLRQADTEEFWKSLMEGMTEICGAQYGFAAKRILLEDQDAAIEMPAIGDPGSCLLGVAFYYNDGKSIKGLHRDYKYLAYGAPCSHLRHDKVFLIPERLGDFIDNNPNKFPFATEAYLGIPLFAEGKCFAHFGMMWTEEALEKKRLGWGYIEMVLHSLEDLIIDRLLQRKTFVKHGEHPNQPKTRVIPSEAVTTSQSLKPYARSLSHELRTPMQGVVGMLDVMHATVQEAVEGHSNPRIRNVFRALRENIEIVQGITVTQFSTSGC